MALAQSGQSLYSIQLRLAPTTTTTTIDLHDPARQPPRQLKVVIAADAVLCACYYTRVAVTASSSPCPRADIIIFPTQATSAQPPNKEYGKVRTAKDEETRMTDRKLETYKQTR
jgi:hypothetical protein